MNEESEISPEETIRKLNELWTVGGGDSDGVRWTREDLHDRSDTEACKRNA